MDTTMPMDLYALEHSVMTGEYSTGMHHHDVSEFHTTTSALKGRQPLSAFLVTNKEAK